MAPAMDVDSGCSSSAPPSDDTNFGNGSTGSEKAMDRKKSRSKVQRSLPLLQEFREYIEADPRLFLYFNSMWDQSNKPSFRGHTIVKNYDHFFELLNEILQSTLSWTPELYTANSAGIPLGDILFYAVATPAGYAAFTDPGVTRYVKRLLDSWGQYLSTPASAADLGTTWLGDSGGRDLLCAVANHAVLDGAQATTLSFEELFECDASLPNYGFNSWDDFFTRRFRHGIRPLPDDDDDDSVVVSACESRCYHIAYNVQYSDRFWIKGNIYSLWDMLQRDTLANAFTGGTIYQAFLSQYSYHRWHSPVSGIVRFAYTLEGTYFAIPEFHEAGSRAHRKDDRSLAAEEWQAWLACQGTRAVVVVEADNPCFGLVCFVAVGMMEVSTVDIKVKEGQKVKRGDEIGMFYYGGSSHCLLFQRGVNVYGFPEPNRRENFPVNSPMARLRRPAT